jgi:gluconokinase
MGVSGLGKTTIGKVLAARTGWKFKDADDYHSEDNRKKMAAGTPLTDADREPWLTALHERMLQHSHEGENVILACSALKRRYRELLAGGFAKDEMRFVYLHATDALIKERLKARDHP